MTANVQRRSGRYYRINRDIRRPSAERSSGRNGRLYGLLLCCAAVGIFAGAYSCSYFAESEKMGQLVESYILSRSQSGFIENFCGSLVQIMLFSFVCFLCGLSAWGSAAGYLIILFRGLGAGMVSAAAIGLTVGSGSGAYVPLILFQALALTVILLSARESVRMSSVLAARMFGSDNSATENKQADLRLYLLKFAVISLLGLAVAAADGGIYCFYR
ncbi:MAG: hypothetical protein ACI4JJ_01170 [Huintestinicola sp.]